MKRRLDLARLVPMTRRQSCAAEPLVWFHDNFRPDGTPYDAGGAASIRRITAQAVPAPSSTPALRP